MRRQFGKKCAALLLAFAVLFPMGHAQAAEINERPAGALRPVVVEQEHSGVQLLGAASHNGGHHQSYLDRVNLSQEIHDWSRSFLPAAVAPGGVLTKAETFEVPADRMKVSHGNLLPAEQLNAVLTPGTVFTYVEPAQVPADQAETFSKAEQHSSAIVVWSGEGNDTFPTVQQQVGEISKSFILFTEDHPEAFWLDRLCRSNGFAVCNDDQSRVFYVSVMIVHQEIVYTPNDASQQPVVNEIYDGRLLKYRNCSIADEMSKRDADVEKIYTAMYASGLREDSSAYEKLQFFNDWLCENNVYNDKAAGGGGDPALGELAHTCVSALAGTNVADTGPVCDGYARAMKVLCDRAGIPCVVVGGNAMGEYNAGHGWNMVQLPDSQTPDELWYGIDVTWNDGANRELFFMVGAETLDTTVGGSSSGHPFKTSHPQQNILLVSGNPNFNPNQPEGLDNPRYLPALEVPNGPEINQQSFAVNHPLAEAEPGLTDGWHGDGFDHWKVYTGYGETTRLPHQLTGGDHGDCPICGKHVVEQEKIKLQLIENTVTVTFRGLGAKTGLVAEYLDGKMVGLHLWDETRMGQELTVTAAEQGSVFKAFLLDGSCIPLSPMKEVPAA